MAQQLQNITVAAPGFAGINTQDSPIGLNPAFASIADNCVIDKYGRVGARKGHQLLTTETIANLDAVNNLAEALLKAATGLEPEYTLFNVLVNGRKLGDINNDGFVNTYDALQYYKYEFGQEIPSSEVLYIENVLLPYVVTTAGYSQYTFNSYLETLYEYIDTSGDKIILSAGNNSIFKGAEILTGITPTGYTITANNWKPVTLNNHVYLFQRDHEPLIGTDHDGTFELEAHSSHSHATGIPPEANEVLAAYGRLWAADVTGNKHTVYWSDLLNGHHWTGGSSGSLDVTTVWPTGFDEIVALSAHNGFLIIFGKKSILVYSGAESPATMTLTDTIEGIGCIARDSVQHTGTDVLFLSDSGVRSLGRTIQEKSMPMSDISKNVRNDLLAIVAAETKPIKSVYSPEESFYLLSFVDSNVTYCFDMRVPIDQSGAHRVTTWSNLVPKAMTVTADGELYFSVNFGISKYSGNKDIYSSYQMRYFSNPLDFDTTSNLKFLKKFNVTIIGGQSTETILNWGYDYTDNYTKQALVFNSSSALAEYGTAEYNIAEYSPNPIINTPKVNTSGSGDVVTVGIESKINGAPFSIQKIDIHALLGRLI